MNNNPLVKNKIKKSVTLYKNIILEKKQMTLKNRRKNLNSLLDSLVLQITYKFLYNFHINNKRERSVKYLI